MVSVVGVTVVPRFPSSVMMASLASRKIFQHASFPLPERLLLSNPLMAWNAGSAAVLASPRAYTVGSGSGSPVFTVRVSGRVRVCWIFCRVGLTVYIRPDVHLYFHLWNCCDVIYPSLFLIFWVRVRVSIRHLLIKFVDEITSPQFHRWKLVLTFSSASRERRVKSLGTRLE